MYEATNAVAANVEDAVQAKSLEVTYTNTQRARIRLREATLMQSGILHAEQELEPLRCSTVGAMSSAVEARATLASLRPWPR